MAVDFPSEEWIEEWRERLNDNEGYEEKGSGWGVDFNGDFIFTIEADDSLDETQYYFVGLEDGKCTDAYRVDDPSEVDYGFEMKGPYTNWKKMTQGEIGAIDGMMSGQFELNGDMQKVMQYSDAAVTMVESAADVDTNYVY